MKIKDDLIYYMGEGDIILSEDYWKIRFDILNNPCQWYECDNDGFKEDCNHPEHFCPISTGLIEMAHEGLDEDGSIIWPEVW